MTEDSASRRRRLLRPRATGRASPPWDRTLIFWLELAYLGALVALAILYFTDVIDPRRAFGPMPVAVPWFGALGGVVISLTGVFDHAHDWDPAQRLWHISRPFLGAIVGMVSVLAFQAGILAAGVNPNAGASGVTPSGIDNVFYYLLAFGVGYREQSFRELMKRMLDVILVPGTTAARAAPTITAVRPSSGPIAGGSQVTITGSGLSAVSSVLFGVEEAQFDVQSDTQLVATSPPMAAAGEVMVILSSPSGTASGPHPYTYE